MSMFKRNHAISAIALMLVLTACGGATDPNRDLVERFYEEGFNQGNVAVIDEVFAVEFNNHSLSAGPSWASGRELYRREIAAFRDAFPDLRITVDDWILDGDKVVARVTWTGTHRGDLPGAPASGNRFEASGIYIYRVSDGKIVESWSEFDRAGFLRQLGVTEEP